MPRVTIDGHSHACEPGETILAAATKAGIDIPALCHDPRIEPVGACRLCLVQVEGHARPVTACNTAVRDDMVIQTHTHEIEELRRTMLKLLASDYPADVVERDPQRPFHRCLGQYDLVGEARGTIRTELIDESHPYICVDMSQCIYCYRCVRICDELQGQFTWRVWNRGDQTRIVPDSGSTLLASSCVSCGACSDTCPTGAIADKTLVQLGSPTRWTKTTCPYCGTGCEMNVGVSGNRITQIRPVLDAPVSKGHLCVKGRYAFGFNDSSDRITSPMIRQECGWKHVSWGDAIRFVASHLSEAIERYGPQQVGMLGSSRATNEENYLTQKFARVVLGTNNVDCCARVCHAPSAAAMKHILGTGAATNSFDDIERARTILLCGANPTENHPIVGARIKQAVLKGANLIVIDPRRIELADYADCHLRVRPGTNIPLLNAMAHVIVHERLQDDAMAGSRIDGWDAFVQSIEAWTPECAAKECGVEAELIRSAARLYATHKPAICFHGLGLTEHTQGTDGVMGLVNLALLTGNIGKPGTGINPLRGQNNVQGAAHMGCEPTTITGAIALGDAAQLVEPIWRRPLPTVRGLNLMQMIDAANAGEFKAIWAIGYDIAHTDPDAARTDAALRSLDLLIVQDLFLNRTAAQYAHVFLPVASPFEKEGTFMNAERRVQRVRTVLDPPGEARADWRILCDVAAAMGFAAEFKFTSPEEIWDEIRAMWPAGRGMTYERLEHSGLQWPCPTADHPGTAILHTDTFAGGARAALACIDYHPTQETVSEEFPFVLTTGRTLYQFNAGTMTMRTANGSLRPNDLLEMSAGDAEKLKLRDGDLVQIRSRYGSAKLRLCICERVGSGELFATFHESNVLLNRVIGPDRDHQVDTPQYKVTAVRVEPVST